MDNKEAIAYIKKYCYGEWCEDEWREAMDTAIEALKTTACNNLATDLQPCKQDDLISRQVANSKICNACGMIDCDQMDKCEKMFTAHPETHEERTETHACDLISRQAAIDAHYEYCNKHPDAGFPVWSLKILEDLPSAQDEIVRCKDCKYWNDEFAKDKSTCWLPCMSMTTHRKWYCGSAERRTDDCV